MHRSSLTRGKVDKLIAAFLSNVDGEAKIVAEDESRRKRDDFCKFVLNEQNANLMLVV